MSAQPKSYFDHTPTIRSHGEMMARLEERTKQINGTGTAGPAGDASDSGGLADGDTNAGVTPARSLPVLTWLEPARDPKGNFAQASTCGRYVIRAIRQTKDRTWVFWPWALFMDQWPKPLEHTLNAEDARAICQSHLGDRHEM